MSSIMHAFIFCFLVLFSFSTVPFAESTKTLKGFSIDLIHRDSPLSPFYNPSTTSSELIKNAALRSISRSNRVGLSLNDNKVLKTITIPDEATGEYFMRIYIGTPPVERFALADTGSDLIWLQCSPCKKCVPQNTPLFDPRKSSTFRSVSCDSQPCTLLPKDQHHCGNSGECKYSYYYADNSFTKGKIGIDVINFGSKGGNKGITFPKFTFGCGYDNKETDSNPTKPGNIGLVGLGAGPLSLVSQLGDDIGHKFSYCFLPLGSNSTSKLTVGKEAMIKGKHVVSTPLIIKSSDPTFYYLHLEGIYVGKKMVKTSKTETNGNIVIDSGTTWTHLETRFYNNFVTLVKEALGVEAEPNPPHGFNFCFRRSVDADFPSFVFRFTGAKVRVNPITLFSLIEDNLFCMLILPNSEDGSSPTFGNQAQVGYQVEYDIKGGKVSFAPADCTKL
ncbi:hypothetical protein VNO77_27795 [Canavalia gladiata]|uniref:Peptidase A1 domain-containing protein n=1 Tax=Canavalia gladiata TaxID=3824 RepID=A0AAN9KYH4_CANGL